MNAPAVELNDALSNSVVSRLLSDFGRRIYFPKGNVAQAAEAKARGVRFDATVGMAYEGPEPMHLAITDRLLPELSAKESVAYAPTTGVRELRELWKQQIVSKNPSLGGIPFSLPIVVPGLTPGIVVSAELFVDPGETVLVPDLFWGNYRLIVEQRCRAAIREFSFFDERGVFNRDAFAAAVDQSAAEGKVALILNFPNNPAGYSPTPEDALFVETTLARAAESVPVLVILDDAYFGLFYDDNSYRESLFARLANRSENILAVKVDGATKEDFAWGYRVGFVSYAAKGMRPEETAALEKKYAGAIRSAVSSSSTVAQNLLVHTYKDPDYAKQKARALDALKSRFRTLQAILADKESRGRAPSLQPLPCNAGYFMSFRCAGNNAEAIRQALLNEGVGTIAVKSNCLRIAFAGIDEEHLKDVYERVFTAAERLA